MTNPPRIGRLDPLPALATSRPWRQPSDIEEGARAARLTDRCLLDLAEALPREIARPRMSKAVDCGEYPDSRGLSELRRGIAARENAKYGLDIDEDHVVVTNGATEALSLLVYAFAQPGTAIEVLAPAIFLYRDIIENHGCRLVPLVHASEVGCKLCFIHSPSNPGGFIHPPEDIRLRLARAEANGGVVVLDQVYDELRHGQARTPESRADLDRGHLVKVNSMSKSFGAPGLRIGWIVCRPDLAEILSGLAERLRIGLSLPSQIAASELLAMTLDALSPEIMARRSLVDAWLEEHDVFDPGPTPAGLCHWLRVRDPELSATELCQRALHEEGVWIVPGPVFWGGDDHHVRLCFGAPPKVLEAGLRGLSRVLARIEKERGCRADQLHTGTV